MMLTDDQVTKLELLIRSAQRVKTLTGRLKAFRDQVEQTTGELSTAQAEYDRLRAEVNISE